MIFPKLLISLAKQHLHSLAKQHGLFRTEKNIRSFLFKKYPSKHHLTASDKTYCQTSASPACLSSLRWDWIRRVTGIFWVLILTNILYTLRLSCAWIPPINILWPHISSQECWIHFKWEVLKKSTAPFIILQRIANKLRIFTNRDP